MAVDKAEEVIESDKVFIVYTRRGKTTYNAEIFNDPDAAKRYRTEERKIWSDVRLVEYERVDNSW